MENLSKDIATKLDDYQKTTLFLGCCVLLLHVITFIVTVILSFYDVQIYLRFGFDPKSSDHTDWVSFALSDSVFR
jgi:hypothetical protein